MRREYLAVDLLADLEGEDCQKGGFCHDSRNCGLSESVT